MTKNLTEGNPVKLIIFFTIPLFIGNVFQQIYSVADAFIVSHTIGIDALSAVGCTGSLSFLIIGFVQGLTLGFSIITGQFFGANDVKGLKNNFVTSIFLGAIFTVFLTAISLLSIYKILEIMRTPENIIDDAYKYISIIFWGLGASLFFNLFSNIIRAFGDSKTPLIALVVACITNIVLDYALILIFHFGVDGAAYATVISQIVATIICLIHIIRKIKYILPKKEDIKIVSQSVKKHIYFGFPMGFQFSVIAVGTIALQAAINNLGVNAVAAYSAASRIDQVAVQLSISFGAAMATFVSQNYGAGKIDRIRYGVKRGLAMAICFSITIGALIIIFDDNLISLFVESKETEVISMAKSFLFITGVSYSILSVLLIYRNSLQGMGESFPTTFAGFMELFMRVAGAFVFAKFFGFNGAVFSNVLAWIGAAVPLFIFYYRDINKLYEKFGWTYERGNYLKNL